jgi:hypothetical protein
LTGFFDLEDDEFEVQREKKLKPLETKFKKGIKCLAEENED